MVAVGCLGRIDCCPWREGWGSSDYCRDFDLTGDNDERLNEKCVLFKSRTEPVGEEIEQLTEPNWTVPVLLLIVPVLVGGVYKKSRVIVLAFSEEVLNSLRVTATPSCNPLRGI